MTIKDAIETLLDTRSYGTADIAKSVAIETMRKYQKIEQIVTDWEKGRFSDGVFCIRVKEVVEDGNVD